MEKEKILETLKGRLGETSLSDKTIEVCIVNANPLAEGAEPDEAYWGKLESIARTFQGQYNKDYAAFVKDYKTRHGEGGNQEPLADFDAVLKRLDKLAADNEQLRERLDKSDRDGKQREFRAAVEREMRRNNANEEYVLRNVLRDVVFDEKETVEKAAERLLAQYDKELSEAFGNGAKPRVATSGNNDTHTAVDEFFAKKWKNK